MKRFILVLLSFELLFAKKKKSKTFEITPEMTTSEVYEVKKQRSIYMMETTAKQINNCVTKGFTEDVSISMRTLKIECVGEFSNIILRAYHRELKELFNAFMILFKEQIEPFAEEFRDESIYIVSLLEMMLRRDLRVSESLEYVKPSVKYHVDPQKFNELLEIVHDDLVDFDDIFMLLKAKRNSIKNEMTDRFAKREKELDKSSA